MAEFCSCGSLKIDGNCTNKNCMNKAAVKAGATKQSKSRSAGTASKALKPPKQESYETRTRRASKCITYNMYDLQNNCENEDDRSVIDEGSDDE